MKKLFIVAICAMGLLSAQAQGKIDFLNVNGGVLNVDGTPVNGPGISGQLWVGASNAEAALSEVGTPASPFAPGTWNAGVVIVPGLAAGTDAFVQLRAWDNSTGADFGAATIKGSSNIAPITLGDPAITLPGPFVATDGFSLADAGGPVIPEPSTVALAILGAAALFIRRRK